MSPIAVAVGIGLLWSFGNVEVRRFERLAAEDLRSSLHGENVSIKVKTQFNGPLGALFGDVKQATIIASGFSTEGLPLYTEPERSKKGIVRTLRLDLSNFELAGLHVQKLEAEIPDCRFDLAFAISQHKMRLSKSGEGTGYVAIEEQALGSFILQKYREIKSATVRVAKDHVFVEGHGEFLIAKARFFVVAQVDVRDGTKLVLTNARILLDGVRAEGLAHDALLQVLNPVVDLNKDLRLDGAISVERLKLRNGLLEAWGRTRIPVRKSDVSVKP